MPLHLPPLVPPRGPASASPASPASAAAQTTLQLAPRAASNKSPPAKQPVTLDDVERRLVAQLSADVPPDDKRRMAKAEFKRLKHCEIVRQSRVRKKNERKGLRQVNDELEKELNDMLKVYRREHDWMHFDERNLRDVMIKKFVHSIYEVRGLRRENSELKDQFLIYDALGEQLQRLQDDFQIPRQLGSRTSIGTIHFQELSVAEARDIMIDSHRQATSFFDTMRRVEVEEQEKTMGWTQHQRITPDGRVQFNFTKRIETIGAEELVDKSWEMYCDFGLYHGIYSSVQKLEILQKINDNTLLIRRDLQEGSSAPIFRTVFLLFRIRLPNGYLICFRSHNPAVCVEDDDDPNVQWMEMFYWLMITDPPAEKAIQGLIGPPKPPIRGCDVTFGGNLLNGRSTKHATIWKYQIAMALLRWESNAAAPLFALYG
ncbi:hypothetical protein PR003_g27060 [Phytophthora rubi]|uniref:START domain-containing protein n=1 Tax=Phytophthora rubi TaxID=129364 RepID=A0A6A4C710_9STRA|nr:hypothetical protein PR002_g12604 [Phytophthora rubi]KAE9026616.1 hypothetical protein PR001_g12157 [Phytophthora rubi]KAE9283692.1 hypothetical protein PR003_g27060 [Phytophthora rubi]